MLSAPQTGVEWDIENGACCSHVATTWNLRMEPKQHEAEWRDGAKSSLEDMLVFESYIQLYLKPVYYKLFRDKSQ